MLNELERFQWDLVEPVRIADGVGVGEANLKCSSNNFGLCPYLTWDLNLKFLDFLQYRKSSRIFLTDASVRSSLNNLGNT